MRTSQTVKLCAAAMALVVCWGCATVPVKQYYVINYQPEPLMRRLHSTSYPFTIRIKKFGIEEAYARPQIVYRKSPFELSYYFYRVWAVSPADMITDAVEKHLVSVGLASHVVQRFDEGLNPDYELSGTIEAIEEYDNASVWFAHLALRMSLTRMRDGRIVYSRDFDSRKQVFQKDPEYVVRELSRILDLTLSQAFLDLDAVLARDFGITEPAAAPPSPTADSTGAGRE
jgi:cholesterol transport system auxiliary component